MSAAFSLSASNGHAGTAQRAAMVGLALAGLALAGAGDTWQLGPSTGTVRQFPVAADWRPYGRLEVDLELVAEGGIVSPPPVVCSVFLVSQDNVWFESRPSVTLTPGETVRFDLRLDPTSSDWEPRNARRPWGPDLLVHVRCWGIKLFSPQPVTGRLRIGELELIPAAGLSPEPGPVRLPVAARVGEPAPVVIPLRDFAGDPYDPAAVDLSVAATGPGGRRMSPTYFRQEYAWVRRHGCLDRHLEPLGRPAMWAAWQPAAAGEYALVLSGRLAGEFVHQSLGRVTVSPAQTAPRSAVDIGLPALGDAPVTGAAEPGGTLLPLTFPTPSGPWYVISGDTWHRVDLAAPAFWRVVLEWSTTWGTYAGLAGYDQRQAWLAEQVLRQSREVRPLVVFADGVLDNSSILNWQDHPCNAANGGFLDDPGDMFGSPRARDRVARRARYLLARYGGLPAVNGIAICVSRAGDEAANWVHELARELADFAPGTPIYSNCPELPARVSGEVLPLATLWRPDRAVAPGTGFSIAGEQAVVHGKYPGAAAVTAALSGHWLGWDLLSIDVSVPVEAGNQLSVVCVLRTGRARVWQGRLTALRNGESNRVLFPLREAAFWQNPDHPLETMPPDELLNVREVSLRFFSPAAGHYAVGIGRAALLGPETDVQARQPALAIEALRPVTAEACQYRLYELSFRLNRQFRNPYDPAEVTVECEYWDPAGAHHTHPGFFMQPRSIRLDGSREAVEPAGDASWRVRITPRHVGRYRYRVQVETPAGSAALEGSFECGPSPDRGFVGLAGKDPRYFEFTDGTLFYPIGFNLRSPGDTRTRKMYTRTVWENNLRAEAEGTFAYARWFERMAANQINYARIWLCPWWLGLEWNRDYPGYHGIGYYNQDNAARLDRIMELAEQHGVYLNIELQNHGAFSSRIDTDWAENPYNRTQPGGFLTNASDFFESPRAQQLHRNKTRYAIARWGYSPHIAFWGVMTESEWVEPYDRAIAWQDPARGPFPRPYKTKAYQHLVQSWLLDAARYVRRLDAHPHLVTAHFSVPHNGMEMWTMPGLDVVHNNAYTLFGDPSVGWEKRRFLQSNGVLDVMHAYGDCYRRFGDRPLLIGEWGGSPVANRQEHLEVELHTGLWSEVMTPLSGATGYWWWHLVDARDLYPHFAAVARFLAGEDLRGEKWASARRSIGTPGGPRHTVTLSCRNRLYAYICHPDTNRQQNSRIPSGPNDPSFAPSGVCALPLPRDMRPGVYRAEYWDTFAGRLLSTIRVEVPSKSRGLPLPSHRVDLAVKLKPAARQ